MKPQDHKLTFPAALGRCHKLCSLQFPTAPKTSPSAAHRGFQRPEDIVSPPVDRHFLQRVGAIPAHH